MGQLDKAWSILRYLIPVLSLACNGSDDGGVQPPGPATTIAIEQGNDQVAAPGAAVAVPPSVKVTDANANPVGDVQVTFAVASGGGSITGENQTTNESGIATVGSWTLGPVAGTNTLTATAAGLSGSPVTFTATGTSVVAQVTLVGGDNHTCWLANSGVTYCWGQNGRGQLGNGSNTNSAMPVSRNGNPSFAGLAGGGAHTCGLTSLGEAFCWGSNDDRQLGNGTTTSSTTPVPVSGRLTFTRLDGGLFHSCGLTTDGSAYCWGDNSLAGQLGDGSQSSSAVPVPVSGRLSFTTVSTFYAHTCGLTADGAAYCWGANNRGQLGEGTITPSGTPVGVSGNLAFTNIVAGRLHTCGITGAGAAYCWGDNGTGQLGDGQGATSLPSSPVPVAVAGGLSFNAIAPGSLHTCGLTADGAAYCWGANGSGQLGNGSGSDSARPVPVSGDLSFSSLAAGLYHTCGVTSSGVYCWGRNEFGQLGDGTTSQRSTPVRVIGLPNQ